MKIRNSIECYILKERKGFQTEILLLHKPATERHPAFWQPVTGGMEATEDPIEACIREVKEETGIALSAGCIQDVDYCFEIYIKEEDLYIYKKLFMTKICAEKDLVLISSEHDDFKWTPFNQVKNDLFWESNLKTFAKIMETIEK